MGFRVYEKNIQLYQKIRQSNIKNRTVLIIILIPYFFVNYIVQEVGEKVFQLWIRYSLKKDKEVDYQYNVCLAAIIKNEAAYIEEWVAYYKIIGVDKIYLYDNESTDGLFDRIKYYVESGFVEYIKFPGRNMQCLAYNDAVSRCKDNTRYLIIVDADEFIVPTKDEPIYDTITRIMKKNENACGIGINWKLFGSSNYEKKPIGLVTQNFTNRALDDAWQNKHVKTIINPRFVKEYISPHFPVYRCGGWSVNSLGKRQRLWFNVPIDFSEIACNHYFGKSKEEYIMKQSRGLADRDGHYDMKKFYDYDLNDKYDPIMLRYKERLNREMERT